MDNGASSYRRFLEGDESAFDEILDLYRENLIFFINRFVRDPAAAEDLAIDAFLELLVHKNRYNFKTSLKTYLFMIGRSRALDYLRHRGKWKFEELSVVNAKKMTAPSSKNICLQKNGAVSLARRSILFPKRCAPPST